MRQLEAAPARPEHVEAISAVEGALRRRARRRRCRQLALISVVLLASVLLAALVGRAFPTGGGIVSIEWTVTGDRAS